MMHIFSLKSRSKNKEIKILPASPYYYVPLLQHIGEVATSLVTVGDYVIKYQLIGKASNGLSANVHAPVSGIVEAIRDHILPDGTEVSTIVIKNDFKEVCSEEFNILSNDVVNYTPDEIVNIIEACGVVGEGGAQFPTAYKYRLEGLRIKTFIVNGAECEPYLTSDYAIMAQRTKELFEAIGIINKVLQVEEVIIAIERQNKELLKVFESFLIQPENKNIKVKVLPNQYPQGGELQLIKSVTGIVLPREKRPREAGVIVSNIGTVYAVYQAVVERKPLISRIVTVSGQGVKHYGNYEVKIGTPVSHILESLNIRDEADNTVIVLGGPMMGKSINDYFTPIIKGTSALLLLPNEKITRSNCILCGYCSDVCPMKLMPMKYEENYRSGKLLNLEKYNIADCIECAACEYICPSNVPLMKSIKEGKAKLKQLKNAI